MKKISVSLSGHQTSISLEPEFVTVLRDIASKQGKSVASVIAEIDSKRGVKTNLSSAIRIWVLKHVMK